VKNYFRDGLGGTVSRSAIEDKKDAAVVNGRLFDF
jgi:hypothetical protein